MADRFGVAVSPSLGDVADRLEHGARSLEDLSAFWPSLAESLADRAQRSWPLRRKTGRLRASLTWAGAGLGKGGIYAVSPSSLRIGTRIFYGAYSQFGTKRQTKRELLSVDARDVADRLDAWTRDRLLGAGLGVG